MKAVIIEDEEMQRRVVELYLKEWGVKTVGAANGYEGLEKCILENPDFVVLDLGLPGMSGLELLALMDEDTRLQGKLVVLTTASLDPDLGRLVLDGHAFYLIRKPIDRNVIRTMYERVHERLLHGV